MPGLTDYGELNVLDEIYNAGAGTFPAADPYISLHSADPADTGANELTGGGYARQQTAFGAAAAGTLSNTGAITWSVPAGNVVAWGVWDAATVGNCLQTGWFNTATPAVSLAICRAADVTANDIQSTAHGLTTDDRVVFEVIEQLTIPAGLTAGTIYFVLAAGLTTDAYRVATTSGGAAIDITAVGSAIARRVLVTNFGGAGSFQVGAAALQIFATE
jgi:hypothetical protein